MKGRAVQSDSDNGKWSDFRDVDWDRVRALMIAIVTIVALVTLAICA